MKLSKLYEMGKYHLVDTTAACAATNPIFSAFETEVSGMSDETSIKARLIITGASYFLLMGSALSRGRDLYRKVFKVKDNISERAQ